MRSRRILLISSNSSERGGGERYLVYLSHGMQCVGIEVYVLVSESRYMDAWAEALGRDGVVVIRKPLVGLRDRPLRFVQSMLDRRQIACVAGVCRDIAPQAILVNQQYDEDGLDYVAGALEARVASVGGVIHLPMTGSKHKRRFGTLRGGVLSWWYRTHPYQLVFVSHGSRDEFVSYYSLPRASVVVNSGVEFRDCRSVLPNLPAPWKDSQIPVVGFAGQFVPQKNLGLLVDSWLMARALGADCRLLLLGDGPTRKALEERLKASAPKEKWYITGWQDQPEKYFSAMDLYAMTSWYEGLPLSLIEAVGYGLPAVVVNFNGADDVAKWASWVQVVREHDARAFGQILAASVVELHSLRAQAQGGSERFRQYFSPARMARDMLSVLGVD